LHRRVGRPGAAPAPTVTDHDDFERQLLELREREKAHTREGAAIAATRRRLPMVEVDASTLLPAWPGIAQTAGPGCSAAA
jgi:predicted dithiol-disulfide oxidoreductase (DUF899 family)